MNKQFQYLFSKIARMILGITFFISWMCLGSYVRAEEPSEVEQMKTEREQFIKEIRRVENLNKKYTKEIEDVRTTMDQKQNDFDSRMKNFEEQLRQEKMDKKQAPAAAAPMPSVTADLEEKTNEILSKGGDMDPEDEKFREELGKAHYNMGNIFFERGEYQRAVVEYYQAVDLMPYDADIHYNLAFVSSEFLGDQETALKHYQWYMYLKPDATDAPLVKEKIVNAKLHMRSAITSPLDKGNGNYNLIR